MNAKKSDGSNLEKNRRFFLEIGFVASLLVVFTAFSFKIANSSDNVMNNLPSHRIESDIIPIKIDAEEKEKVIPKPKVLVQPNSFVVVNKPQLADTLSGFGIENPNMPNNGSFEPEAVIEPLPFVNPQKKPSFPGGVSALLKFVHDNLNYSEELVEARVQGIVVMKFIVGKDGKAQSAEVINSPNSLLAKAVTDVIAKLPLFEPGEQAGEKVPAYFVLPVEFKLQ